MIIAQTIFFVMMGFCFIGTIAGTYYAFRSGEEKFVAVFLQLILVEIVLFCLGIGIALTQKFL